MILPLKNSVIFAGTTAELIEFCGATVIADGLITTNRGYSVMALQFVKRVPDGKWQRTNRFLPNWAKQNGVDPKSKQAQRWFENDPRINALLAKDGKLFTPRGNLLEGVTRRSVFELAKEMGAMPIEKPLTPDDLRSADEAFTSTTAGGITPVTQVDGKTLGNGAPGILTTRLTDEYWRRREAGWHGTRVEDVLQERDVA